MQEQSNEGHRKERVGVVVSDRMDKTVVVAIDSFRRHRIYKKVLRRTARYKAHDEENEASVGDLVRIRESRPLSRLKRWRVVEIVQRHEVAETKPADIDRSMVEELERRRREPVEEPVVDKEPAAEVEEPAEVPEVEEVAAEPEEVTVEEAVEEAVEEVAAEPEEVTVDEAIEEAIEEVAAEPVEVPVEKAESSEEPAEGPADDSPKASRGRKRSAAEPAEGAAEPAESEKAEGE